MTLSVREANNHVDRILDLVRRGLSEDRGDVVAQSWSRCLNKYSLHPGKPHDPIVRGARRARGAAASAWPT